MAPTNGGWRPDDTTDPRPPRTTVVGPRGRDTAFRGTPGDTVAGYRLIRIIGRGGMGEVWEAVHERHEGRTAIKLIFKQPYRADQDDEIAREFKLLVHLRHQHIVRVWDAGVHRAEDGRSALFVVMEYIPDARSITDYADVHKLTTLERLRLFEDVAAAVAYVHKHGQLHLDIKPANIMVDGDGRVFLADFGISRPAVGWNDDGVAGTPAYMGPEHLAGDAEVIHKRADVWSMGVVLFELITGSDPFDLPRHSSMATRAEAVAHPPRTLAAASPDLPDEIPDILPRLEAIVAGCLCSLDDRYESGTAVADALRTALAPHGWRRVVTLKRTHPRIWASLVMMVVVLVSTGVGLFATKPIVLTWPQMLQWYAQVLVDPVVSITTLNELPAVKVLEFDFETGKSLTRKTDDGEEYEYPELSRVDSSDKVTYRWMHEGLIDRLLEVGAAVVVFDIRFAGKSAEPDEDKRAEYIAATEALGKAIEGARDADPPLPVVIGTYWQKKSGRPVPHTAAGLPADVADVLVRSRATWGDLGTDIKNSHYVTNIAIDGLENARAIIPSLSVAAVAAYAAPDCRHYYTMDDGRLSIVHQQGPEQLLTTGVTRVRASDRYLNSDLSPSAPDVWFGVVQLPSEEALAASTVRYEDFWRDPDSFRDVFAGQIIFVRDRNAPDHVVDEEGVAGKKLKTVSGAFIHIAAIQMLLSGETTRIAGASNLILAILASLAGCMVVWRLRRPRSSRRTRLILASVLTFVVIFVLIIGICIAVRWFEGTLLFPVPAILASGIAICLAIWVTRPVRSTRRLA